MNLRYGLLALTLTACGGKSPTGYTGGAPGGGGPSASVVVSGSAYSPSSIAVSVGTTVRWTNNDGISHTVTADGGAFNAALSGGVSDPYNPSMTTGGGTFQYTFSSAGAFAYHCNIHAAMHGTVTVNP